MSEELNDEGVPAGRYFKVTGDGTNCWRTGGWRPGWHCTGWPEWFTGISRGESLYTFMNLYVGCLVQGLILDHEPVSETFVFVSGTGYFSTGAASGQYQLREEEDVSPSTGVSSSRNSYKRREV